MYRSIILLLQNLGVLKHPQAPTCLRPWLPLYCPHWITVMWCGLGTCTKTAAKKLEVVQVMLFTNHQQLHWEPNWAANFREKTGTPYCNLRVSMSQARTFPLLICTIYFSLSRNSTSITLDWVKNFIIIPRAHMNMMSRSFHYKGAVVWNSLPDDIKGGQGEHLQSCPKTVLC